MVRKNQRIALLLLTSLLIAGGAFATDSKARPVPKALFIIIDGVPADVIEKTATPNIDEISAAGGYTRAHVGGVQGTESQTPTVSAPGYQSLITGTWGNKHNVLDNRVDAPNYNYWDIFRIAKAYDSSLLTAVFSTWEDNRTKLIGDGLEAAGGSKIDHYSDGYELDTERFPHDEASNYIRDIDALVATDAATYVKESGPDLSWVYLQYTDDIGHGFGDSAQQEKAVKIADQLVGKIWAAIKERQSLRNEDWLIVVTTDHGRDSKDGRDHGGQSPRERQTWIATNSARLNRHFHEDPAIVDILPSIATHLRLGMPPEIKAQLDGESFVD